MKIRDDGTTLNEEELAKATAPYYQGDNTKAGMGLGLGMISSILWELDGDLQIANRETMKGAGGTVRRGQGNGTLVHDHQAAETDPLPNPQFDPFPDAAKLSCLRADSRIR